METLDIKSPIFKPNPGWGGKLKIWFKKNFSYNLFLMAIIALVLLALYLKSLQSNSALTP